MNQAHKLFKALKYRLTSRVICDNCGKVNPNILKTKSGYSRYTQCCAYTSENSAGKTMTQRLRFPVAFWWTGFWT
jgi:uncharacterized Zn finger protein